MDAAGVVATVYLLRACCSVLCCNTSPIIVRSTELNQNISFAEAMEMVLRMMMRMAVKMMGMIIMLMMMAMIMLM